MSRNLIVPFLGFLLVSLAIVGILVVRSTLDGPAKDTSVKPSIDKTAASDWLSDDDSSKQSGATAAIHELEPTTQTKERLENREAEIAGMMQEYEKLRDDPEQREKHLEKMKIKLKGHSKDVLSVVLAKIEQDSSEQQ